MRPLSVLFTIFAIGLTILTLGLIVLYVVSGVDNVLFPGLGLVVSLPFTIVLMAFIDALIILLALLLRSSGTKS